MKTDLKIGIVVGIIVVVVVIIYTANKPEEQGPALPFGPNEMLMVEPAPAPVEVASPNKGAATVVEPIVTPNTVVITPPASEKAEKEAKVKVPATPTTPAGPPVKVVEVRAPRYHTVEEGESLYGISEQYYGNGKYWKDIQEANKDKIKNENILQAGWKLRIPYSDELARKYQP